MQESGESRPLEPCGRCSFPAHRECAVTRKSSVVRSLYVNFCVCDAISDAKTTRRAVAEALLSLMHAC